MLTKSELQTSKLSRKLLNERSPSACFCPYCVLPVEDSYLVTVQELVGGLLGYKDYVGYVTFAEPGAREVAKHVLDTLIAAEEQ